MIAMVACMTTALDLAPPAAILAHPTDMTIADVIIPTAVMRDHTLTTETRMITGGGLHDHHNDEGGNPTEIATAKDIARLATVAAEATVAVAVVDGAGQALVVRVKKS